jgi:hypothetical protein
MVVFKELIISVSEVVLSIGTATNTSTCGASQAVTLINQQCLSYEFDDTTNIVVITDDDLASSSSSTR